MTHHAPDANTTAADDFMPVQAHGGVAHNLVRRVKTVRGELRYRMRCRPRFDYGRAGHKASKRGDCVVFEAEDEGRTTLFLESSVPLQLQDGDAVAEFFLGANQHATFVSTAPEEGGEGSPFGDEAVGGRPSPQRDPPTLVPITPASRSGAESGWSRASGLQSSIGRPRQSESNERT